VLQFLTEPFAGGPAIPPFDVFVRLIGALILGGVVAWIYRRTRGPLELAPSFPTTLILLSILIAMVTQVIGDNVARAFSLVGALSIVRFRTVVRDTQDTAYVIFAVVSGMAVGAADLWVAGIGLGVVGLAAFLTMPRRAAASSTSPIMLLSIRMALGHDPKTTLEPVLDRQTVGRHVVSMSTARQGLALDVTYETRLFEGVEPASLVQDINRLDGVQSVELRRKDSSDV
jgi:hypothetical protein